MNLKKFSGLLLCCGEMEKVEKSQRALGKQQTELFLQWGNRKRLRCVRVRDPELSDPSYVGAAAGRLRRKITSRFVGFSEKEASPIPSSHRLTRKTETGTVRSDNNRRSSPEEDKYYPTRGTAAVVGLDCHENGKVAIEGGGGGAGTEENKKKAVVWPKLYIGLSSKEKEEDFMAMKGCKLPHRPKKRAKTIQRTLLLVSPGAWLTDMCQERYEVREKKSSKKARPRGLKAMGSMESDSE